MQVFSDEGVSAKRADNRPQLQAALALAQLLTRQEGRGHVALLVFKLDRLARCTLDTLSIAQKLDKAGVALHSLCEKLDTSSAAGRFFYSLLASLAEMERAQIAERTLAALDHKRAKGERIGALPFGLSLASDGVSLEEDEAEQAVLARIERLLESGLTQQAVVDELNASNTPAKHSSRWNRSSLRSVLKTQARRLQTA